MIEGPPQEFGAPGTGRDVLAAAGPVGIDLLEVDWARTSLGPPEQWPRSLVAAVNVVLRSRFSMWMAWGPDLTFFCNDAYRRDTLAGKYPWALGRPAREVWSEIWDEIGPRIERVIEHGEATWDEALQLFLERSGYLEETFHTFSYSPLTGDMGEIEGMLCVVSEDTQRVIGQRRLATLTRLGAAMAGATGEAEVYAAAMTALDADQKSLPFSLIYEVDGDHARLVATSGAEPGAEVAPERIPLASDRPWPVGSTREIVLDDLQERFSELPTGNWTIPPRHAVVLPFEQGGQSTPSAVMIAAVNPYRMPDGGYLTFVEQVARQIAASVSSAHAYDQERARADELTEVDRAKTLFFTNISHELRTPLTLLLGPTEDALADTRHPLAEPHRRRLEIVARNGQRLLKLVNTLLDFSRLEAERAEPSFRETDIAGYTRELVSMFESSAERAGLRMSLTVGAIDAPVYVDAEMWSKVVMNLLSNALKHTFEGSIDVTLAQEDADVVLKVRDTGTGIPARELPKLFDRFHRVSGARSRSHEGSGIGLALVRELVALHGGEVLAHSRIDEGSTFTVRIPTGREHLPEGAIGDDDSGRDADRVRLQASGYLSEALPWIDGDLAETPIAPSTARDLATASGDQNGIDRARLLIADDNPDMRRYVADLLAATHDVSVAADGAEALEMIREDPPDLVLTDVMMPRLDGFGLLRALRSDPATVDIPVVMVSARAGEEGMVEGLEAGANDYLVKPFTARELIARVNANLEFDRVRRARDRLARNQVLLDQAQKLARVGSWEIDLERGEVTRSPELMRMLGLDGDDEPTRSVASAITDYVHEDDRERLAEAVRRGREGHPVDEEIRVLPPERGERIMRTLGETVYDDDGNAVLVRGSVQDITEQREAERKVAAAVADRRAAAREREIADSLQRSLLPAGSYSANDLEVASFYRAGEEGTHVGGDWYDVIELASGKVVLVIGDVMGRGVLAAAVMGQLRAAVRAYARLELDPEMALRHLDEVVVDVADGQIVTCIFMVYDPATRELTFANAGHLPAFISRGGQAIRLAEASAPPLGSGFGQVQQERVTLDPLDIIVLYTDGLVERRDRDLDEGIEKLARCIAEADPDVATLADDLVAQLADGSADDDIAVLTARTLADGEQMNSATIDIDSSPESVGASRRFVSERLEEWGVDRDRIDDVVLAVSELVTNALRHGNPPALLTVRNSNARILVEVIDGREDLPVGMQLNPESETGRGLMIVEALASRWGARTVAGGKSVWALLPLR